MPSPIDRRLDPPADAAPFERLVCTCANVKWNTTAFRTHARNGQKQKGVDVFARTRKRHNWIVIQCKNTPQVTLEAIKEEVRKAEALELPIKEFWMATTAVKDGKIQRLVTVYSKERERSGRFPVDILYWDDLQALLCSDPSALRKHGYSATDGSNGRLQHDRNLFQELKKALSSPVRTIGRLDFHDPFSLLPVADLDSFLERWNTIETAFFDRKMRNRFRAFYENAHKLSDGFENLCSPYGVNALWVLPHHLRQRMNQQDRLDVKRLINMQRCFIAAYEHLIRGGRRQLYPAN